MAQVSGKLSKEPASRYFFHKSLHLQIPFPAALPPRMRRVFKDIRKHAWIVSTDRSVSEVKNEVIMPKV